MTMHVYVVFDRLANESGPLFEAKNDAVARRNYDRLVSQAGRPDEYQLLRLGIIDHDNQKLEVYEIPVEVGREVNHE
jgi:hypothetical protein